MSRFSKGMGEIGGNSWDDNIPIGIDIEEGLRLGDLPKKKRKKDWRNA
jgi:hypothetical protein